MVDNTLQNGTANMATDDVAGVHYQIVKAAFGALDTATLVTTAVPFPVKVGDGTNYFTFTGPADGVGEVPGALVVPYNHLYNNTSWVRARGDITSGAWVQLRAVAATGTITTQNLVPAGVATAGSAVELSILGRSSLSIQVTGTYTGALSLQGTVDGTTWVTIGGAPLLNVNTAAFSPTIASAVVGVFQAEAAGFAKVRVTALAAVTGTATVTLESGQDTAVMSVASPLPVGTNVIGALTANQSVNLAQVAGVATPVGNGTAAGSQRVSIASDNTPIPIKQVTESDATFRGRSQTFRIPGLAGTAGQKLFALHNATGSTKVVHINQLTVDIYQTVAKAVTVAPPIIRIHRFTAIPTGGTACAKVAKDTTLASNVSITAWQGASADGTGTTLNVTIPASNMLTQEFSPRIITAAGYEMFDSVVFLEGDDIVLRALEGIVVFLDYTLATQNPVTDMWVAGCDWYETN